MGMRLCACAMALCLSMAACSGEPEPMYADPTPPASGASNPEPTSEPPSPPPTPTSDPPEVEQPPALPAAARRDDAVGAEAFVRHYWAMVNYAQSTLDTERLSALATTECVGCAGGQRFIDEVADTAGTIRGGEYTIVGVDELRRVPGPENEFTGIAVLTSNTQRVTTPGEEPITYPAGRSMQTMTLRWGTSGWKLTFLGPAS